MCFNLIIASKFLILGAFTKQLMTTSLFISPYLAILQATWKVAT